MKKIVEVENEGLVSLMGEKVTLFCASYFYTGKLIGVNKDFAKLEDPSIIYETGPWSKDEWENVQSLPSEFLYVMIQSIESFGVVK